jgi:hypothetical protein
MKPEDVTLSEEGGIPLKDFLAMNADLGFFVYFRDSQILHLRADTPVELIRSFCKMQDANGRDRQQELTKYVIE